MKEVSRNLGFKFVDKILKKKYNLKKNKNLEIIDVGCATGEFLFFLKNKYPNLNLSGMDIMSDLIDKAKKDVKDVKFHVGDITNPKKYLKKKFDIVIFMGVHSIWDDPNDWFPFLLKLCKKNGRLYIFVSGKRKFKIDRFNYSKEYLSGKIKWLQEDIHGVNKEVEKLAFSLASDYIKYLRTMNSTFKMELNKGNTELLSYQIAQVLDLSNEDRQRILETKSTEERLQMEIQVMREYVNTSPSTSYG